VLYFPFIGCLFDYCNLLQLGCAMLYDIIAIIYDKRHIFQLWHEVYYYHVLLSLIVYPMPKVAVIVELSSNLTDVYYIPLVELTSILLAADVLTGDIMNTVKSLCYYIQYCGLIGILRCQEVIARTPHVSYYTYDARHHLWCEVTFKVCPMSLPHLIS